jgi:hypothetical protein
MADARNQREAAGELHPGDHVEWGAPVPGRRKASGEVVEVVTEDTTVGKNHFKASEDNPKVRVKSGKTGKEAVHKPTSVRKTEDGLEDNEEEGEEEEEEEEEEDQ